MIHRIINFPDLDTDFKGYSCNKCCIQCYKRLNPTTHVQCAKSLHAYGAYFATRRASSIDDLLRKHIHKQQQCSDFVVISRIINFESTILTVINILKDNNQLQSRECFKELTLTVLILPKILYLFLAFIYFLQVDCSL